MLAVGDKIGTRLAWNLVDADISPLPIGTEVDYEYGIDRTIIRCVVCIHNGKKQLHWTATGQYLHGQNGVSTIVKLP